MTNHPNRNQYRAIGKELLAHAKLLEKSLLYYIRKDERDGDDEGANLKSYTLHTVRETIAKAERILA